MTSPKTMREPMMALTPDRVQALKSASKNNAKDSDKDKQSGGSPRRPARKMMSPLKADGAAEASNEEAPEAEEVQISHTLVEGLRAVPRDGEAGEEVPKTVASMPAPKSGGTQAPESAETPAPSTGRMAAPGSTNQLRWVVGATLAGCLIIVGGLSWLHLERQDDDEGPRRLEAPRIVDIEAGHFRRGLADNAQGFIMMFCQRYHDNAEDNCERDQLLAGEFPEQTVNMPAYRIDSGPVRNRDYQDCVEAESCEPVAFDDCHVWTPRGLQSGARVPQVLREGDRPVVCVDRQRAATYCQWRGGDLPSHNQWEKGARGSKAVIFPWGDYWEPDYANWGERDVMRTSIAGKLDGHVWTSPPGAYPDSKSPYELDDMAGNVSEWVRNDDDPLRGHVRGGSWVSNPFELRTTARTELPADAQRTDVGFRCAYPAQ